MPGVIHRATEEVAMWFSAPAVERAMVLIGGLDEKVAQTILAQEGIGSYGQR